MSKFIDDADDMVWQQATPTQSTVAPLTPEDEASIEVVAFTAMREIHKRGGTPFKGVAVGPVRTSPPVGNLDAERTPEQRAERERTLRRDAKLLSLAAGGQKFTLGRKTGAVSPIRKAIARELKKCPGMKNRELWDAIAAKPPKGWEFLDNSLGQYAEGDGGGNMSYARFCNVCAEERRTLKA